MFKKQIISEDSTRENYFMLPGKDYQYLILKNIFTNEEQPLNGFVQVINWVKETFKEEQIEIEFVHWEQPIYKGDVLDTKDLLKLGYDLFFKVNLHEISFDLETVLKFLVLKEKTGLDWFENTKVMNPYYQKDKFYSDAVNGFCCWDIQVDFKNSIYRDFDKVFDTLPDELKNYGRRVVDAFGIISPIPPYIADTLKQFVTDETNDFIHSIIDLSSLLTQSEKQLLIKAEHDNSYAELLEYLIHEVYTSEQEIEKIIDGGIEGIAGEIKSLKESEESEESEELNKLNEINNEKVEKLKNKANDFMENIENMALFAKQKSVFQILTYRTFHKYENKFDDEGNKIKKVVTEFDNELKQMFDINSILATKTPDVEVVKERVLKMKETLKFLNDEKGFDNDAE